LLVVKCTDFVQEGSEADKLINDKHMRSWHTTERLHRGIPVT